MSGRLEIQSKHSAASGMIFYMKENDLEVARAYLYVLQNTLHKRPFGLIEDVFVSEQVRGTGIGTCLVTRIIEEAKKRNCYKLICTSRHENERVHSLYKKMGFTDHGLEFRMNF